MNILLTGAFSYSNAQIKKIESLGYNVTFIKNELEELNIDVSNIDVVICNRLFLHNDINKFKNLKVIQTTSAGLDRIPLEYTKKNNIRVFNAGNSYSIPMAEFAIMQLLNIYKNNKQFVKNQLKQKWEVNRELEELSDKKVLIMGFGNVGFEIAKRLYNFVSEIYAYDIKKVDYDKVIYVSDYKKIIETIDIIILTMPLVKETKYIVNKSFIENLKQGSTLINVSRGKLINEKDLIEAIKSNKFLGVALDVFEEEPLYIENELWSFDNVYITPHNSFVSKINKERLFKVILENLRLIK